MNRLFARAKQLWQEKTGAALPVLYRRRCRCGQMLEGTRQDRHQVLTCPTCSAAVFILSRSPLPPLVTAPVSSVKAVASKRKRRKSRPAFEDAMPAGSSPTPLVEAVIAVAAQPEANPDESPDAGLWDEVDLEKVKRPRRSPRERVVAAIPPPPPVPWEDRFLEAAKQWIPPRRWFTTPRLIFAGVCLLVIVTLGWQWSQAHRRYLREELVPRGRKGLQAMAAAEWETARENLRFTINALDELREPFPDQQLFRQGYAEVLAQHDLLDNPLDRELAGATTSPAYLNERIAGRTVIFDTVVQPSAAGWEFEVLLFADDHPVTLHPAGLELFRKLAVGEPTRFIFAARLDRLEHDSQLDRWYLRLQPASGVLLTDAGLYETLGLYENGGMSRFSEKSLPAVSASPNPVTGRANGPPTQPGEETTEVIRQRQLVQVTSLWEEN